VDYGITWHFEGEPCNSRRSLGNLAAQADTERFVILHILERHAEVTQEEPAVPLIVALPVDSAVEADQAASTDMADADQHKSSAAAEPESSASDGEPANPATIDAEPESSAGESKKRKGCAHTKAPAKRTRTYR
jgi:hypothetical protein